MTLAEVADATGGTLADATGDEVVDGVAVVDSRIVGAGDLFVAVPGEHVDGHDYALGAVAAGATGVLGTRRTGAPSVLVAPGEDGAEAVVAALGRLARATLAAAPDVRVTAVTGSSGKTSTKDLLAQVLPAAGPTVASPGSYNNDLGLPLTVLAIDSTTRHLVLEMGSRGRGHIARLCRIAPPHTGAVLNVGLAHVGEFGSRELTAVAKGELVEALEADGVAVLNADDPLVAAMAHRTGARVVTFGLGDGAAAEVRAADIGLDADGRARFHLLTPAGAADVQLRLVGAHHVLNALAATAAGLAAGIDVDRIAAALAEARPLSRWRMEVHHRADGVTVVNDAYNANPDSMRTAVEALVALGGTGGSGLGSSPSPAASQGSPPPTAPDNSVQSAPAGGHGAAGRGRRTWAVLGEMLELGPETAAEHQELGRLVMRAGVDRLVVVGEGARQIHTGAQLHRGGAGRDESQRGGSVFVPDVAAALALLTDELRPGDVVLVKSSRAAGLSDLGEALVSTSSGGAFHAAAHPATGTPE